MKTKPRIEAKLETGARNQAGARHRTSAGSQRGASVIEMVFLMTFLSLLLIGVVDMGRAFYVSIEVADAARAAAMYAYQTQATAQDAAGIQTAATNDAPTGAGPGADLKGITMNTTSSYGCMCSDGTSQLLHCSANPSCSSGAHKVNYVIVTTTATYAPLFPWPGVPSSIPITGKAQMFAGQ